MARFIIQSARTHQFLHFNPATGDVGYTPSLLTALQYGVAYEPEEVQQLITDHGHTGQMVIVDLDADYPD